MININNNQRKNIASDLTPDLTPLLDVVFMLIIFLILSVNSALYSLEVNLPKDKENSSQVVANDQQIAIHLLANDQDFKIDDKIYKQENDFRQALSKLAKKDPELKVIIFADEKASIAKLVNLFTLLEKLKIKQTNIAVEKSL